MLSCATAGRSSNSDLVMGILLRSVVRPRTLAVVAPLLDLGAGLAGDEAPAAERAHGISRRAALNTVPLPGLLPQDEDGDARKEAAEEAAQPATLAHIVGIAFDETARDTRAAQA